MKKILLLAGFGLLLASCGNAFCDCDLYEDNYTWDGFDYQLNSSTMTVEDTCLTITGAGAYLKVLRVECP